MLIGGDYVFSLLNFIGLNISVIGSVIYTKVTFSVVKQSPKQPATLPTVDPVSTGKS